MSRANSESTSAVVSVIVSVVTCVTSTVSVAGSNEGRTDGAALMLGFALGRVDILGRALGKLLGSRVWRSDGTPVGDMLGIS